MPNFNKPFRGVRAGEIYPTDFAAGSECPAELEAAAIASGAIETGPALSPAQQLVAGKPGDVIAAIADQKDPELLEQAKDAETAGKNRSTVIAALESAIAQLKV